MTHEERGKKLPKLKQVQTRLFGVFNVCHVAHVRTRVRMTTQPKKLLLTKCRVWTLQREKQRRRTVAQRNVHSEVAQLSDAEDCEACSTGLLRQSRIGFFRRLAGILQFLLGP